MEVFRVSPDLTLFHVVLLRVLEAQLEVCLDLFEERILAAFESLLDVIEGYGPLDLLVIVGILPFGR